MSDFQKHLYAIMHPNRALVASQLEPLEFGKQYSVGTKRYYEGKVLFIEVDPEFRNDYFEIEKFLKETVAHEDGTPKRTKIISSYRVLEHIDIEALGDMYVVNVSGQTIKLPKAEYEGGDSKSGEIRIIQEINPLQLLVATTQDHKTFGAQMTSEGNPKGAPKLFYTELDLDVDGFLTEWEKNPFLPPPIPGVHPQKLSAALKYLKDQPEATTTTIGLASVLDKVVYRALKEGFFVSHGEKINYYPFPSLEELQRDHYAWYRSTD
jgi:hypothetical protein